MFKNTYNICSITEMEEAKILITKYDELMKKLEKFDKFIFQNWKEKVPKQIEENLDQPLFYRSIKSHELYLNFHPQVY